MFQTRPYTPVLHLGLPDNKNTLSSILFLLSPSIHQGTSPTFSISGHRENPVALRNAPGNLPTPSGPVSASHDPWDDPERIAPLYHVVDKEAAN